VSKNNLGKIVIEQVIIIIIITIIIEKNILILIKSLYTDNGAKISKSYLQS